MNGARLLLDGLFEDTALLPPACLSLSAAVARHAEYRRSASGWMLGRLVVPVGALPALIPLVAAQTAEAFPRPWGLSVIGSGNVEEDRQTLAAVSGEHTGSAGRLVVGSLDVTVHTPFEVRRLRVLARDGWPVHCEPIGDLNPLLDSIAISGVRATLRASAIGDAEPPSAEALARMLAGCVQRGISMKAAGGLQRALTVDGRPGYLNLLVAAGVAQAAGAAAVRAPEVVATIARILQLTARPSFSPGGVLEWADDGGPRTEGPLHDLAPAARALLRGIASDAFEASASDAGQIGLA